MSDVSMSKIVYSAGLIISLRERKFHANYYVENESSRELCFQEWKFQGMKVPGDECSRERKFSGTKVPVTD